MSKNENAQSRQTYWHQHYKAWKTSGQSQAEYAQHCQLKLHAFRYWITKFNQPSIQPAKALVRVPLQAIPVRETFLELIVEGKYRLIIRPGFDAGSLQAVVSSLEDRSCS